MKALFLKDFSPFKKGQEVELPPLTYSKLLASGTIAPIEKKEMDIPKVICPFTMPIYEPEKPKSKAPKKPRKHKMVESAEKEK